MQPITHNVHWLVFDSLPVNRTTKQGPWPAESWRIGSRASSIGTWWCARNPDLRLLFFSNALVQSLRPVIRDSTFPISHESLRLNLDLKKKNDYRPSRFRRYVLIHSMGSNCVPNHYFQVTQQHYMRLHRSRSCIYEPPQFKIS